MARIIGLALRLLGLVVFGTVGGLAGFGMGGPLGAVLLFAITGFIGFFAAPMVWRSMTKPNEGR